MQSLDPEGLYVLPPQLCSERRREFFVRANQILGSYSIIFGYSNFGKNWIEREAKKGRFIETTPMRITINGRTIQTTYRKLKEMYKKGVPRLSNYIFLMIYGNFETFLSDLVCDGLTKQGQSSPIEETIRLMMTTKWIGRLTVSHNYLTSTWERIIANRNLGTCLWNLWGSFTRILGEDNGVRHK